MKGGGGLFAATPDVDGILNGLNQEQKEAVMETDGPLLVIAGAGSGKTSVLTRRIAYLIAAKRVAPWSILAITFTNKAAKEMRHRLEGLIGPYATDVWAATFHSTCVKILRRDIDKMGWNRNFTILDDTDVTAVLKRILTNQNVNIKQYDPKSVKSAISSHKNVLRTAARVRDLAGNPYEKIIGDAYLEYERQLRQNNSLDFDDLIMKTVQLFEHAPEVLDFYQNKFQYIHVDEYQDTNHAQYRLVHLLAQKRKNLCVVGDSDQSIYGWRGADIQNILQFERDYPQAKVVLLEQNYRSTKRILQIANHVIENNKERKPKTLRTDNSEGDKATLYKADNEHDEARFVADTIESGRQTTPDGYSGFAILYRTNAQSRVIEEVLMQRGIPYRIYGGLKFYDRKEIKDLLAYLRLVANPADEISLRRVINVPKRGIGNTTLAKLDSLAETRSYTLYDALQFAEQTGIRGNILRSIAGFTELIGQLAKMVDYLNLTELTREILKKSGYREALGQERTLESEARIENLDEFLTVTMEFDKRWDAGAIEPEVEGDNSPSQRLTTFLAEVALVADTDLNGGKPEGGTGNTSVNSVQTGGASSDGGDEQQVSMMTLHSAKGLEFPHVFVVGMEEGIFPHNRILRATGGTTLDQELEEERRLCYVGVTRAKERLYLTFSNTRTIFGEFRRQQPSRFLSEMPSNHVELPSVPDFGHPSRFLSPQGMAPGYGAQNRQFGLSKGTIGAADSEPKSFDYKVGDKVEHRKWGVGTVVQVRGEGEDMMATIAFPKPTGLKELAVKFAPIQKAEGQT